MFPEIFGRASNRHGEPTYAILLLTGIALVAVTFGSTLLEYATVVVLILMLSQVVVGVAALRIPAVLARRYDAAEFRLSPGWLTLVSVGLMAGSASFFVLGLFAGARVLTLAGLIVVSGAIFYGIRVYTFRARGLVLAEVASEHLDALLAETNRSVGQS